MAPISNRLIMNTIDNHQFSLDHAEILEISKIPENVMNTGAEQLYNFAGVVLQLNIVRPTPSFSVRSYGENLPYIKDAFLSILYLSLADLQRGFVIFQNKKLDCPIVYRLAVRQGVLRHISKLYKDEIDNNRIEGITLKSRIKGGSLPKVKVLVSMQHWIDGSYVAVCKKFTEF